MKYIRTENGVYEVVDFDNECIIPSPIIKMDGRLTHCCDYKKYRQADTIEELCDEFVLIDKMTGKYCLNDVNDYYYLKEEVDEYKVFGAIWTDKGLIYVAKMNDKGELKLL